MVTVQHIRLVDVFILGPTMMYVGWKATGIPDAVKIFLFVSGLLTITFNGQRFFQNLP